MKKLILTLIILLIAVSAHASDYEEGSFLVGGTFVNITRVDNNDDWIIVNGGRYRYEVVCGNCGECWNTTDDDGTRRCFMVSESWKEMQTEKDKPFSKEDKK